MFTLQQMLGRLIWLQLFRFVDHANSQMFKFKFVGNVVLLTEFQTIINHINEGVITNFVD